MSEIKDYYQLDSEEAEILEAYYQGRLDGPPVPESMVAAAKQTLKKNKNINIQISENDLESIKLLAAREGMPYQTLIGSLIHKYASGYLEV
jgi:predicted DNA binding CopG/RHH family protein